MLDLRMPEGNINLHYTRNKLEQFWVGLMDSDGSVQCNHLRKKYLQYRIVIHLAKSNSNNLAMLKSIHNYFGGSVRVLKDNSCIWVENHQRRIWKLCEIFDRYPPLTTRLQCQLSFLKKCATQKDVAWMLQQRKTKFLERDALSLLHTSESLRKLDYFPTWLSGFITGEGCFSIRKRCGKKSFSIAQKHDRFLLEAIRDYFSATNSVRALKKDMFVWKVYKRDVLHTIFIHCNCFPLLGHKEEQFRRFYEQ